MKYLIIFIFSFSSLKAQYLWQFYSDTIIKWNYYEGDEFNGESINLKKWYIGFPWGRALFSQNNYVLNSNFVESGGKMDFIAKELDSLISLTPHEVDSNFAKKNKITAIDGNKFPFKYSTALLWSKKSYRYGYFEIKFKGVEGQGIWPAFWLYGGNPNYEIDFFELKGEKEKRLHVDVHCPSGCANFYEILGYRKGWGHWVDTDEKLKSGFNIVSGEWGKNYIKWFLNGSLIAYSDINIETPMSLVVGTGVATENGPFKPSANKKTPFPNYFTVDYIRVFNRDSLPNYEIIKENFSEETATFNAQSSDLSTKGKYKRTKTFKRSKPEDAVTISVLQNSNKSVDIRVLGAAENKPVKITFMDTLNNTLGEFLYNDSRENLFLCGESKMLKIKIEVNTQVTIETLNLE